MGTVYDFYSEDPKGFYKGFEAFCLLFKSFSEEWLAKNPEENGQKAGFYFAAALVDSYLGEVATNAKEMEEGKKQTEEQKLQLEQFKIDLEKTFEI
jgi:hypothetical protein